MVSGRIAPRTYTALNRRAGARQGSLYWVSQESGVARSAEAESALPERRKERETHGEATIPRRSISPISGILPGRPACWRGAARDLARGGTSHDRRLCGRGRGRLRDGRLRRGGGSLWGWLGHGLRLKRLTSTQRSDRLGIDRHQTRGGAPVASDAVGAGEDTLRGSILVAAFSVRRC